MGGRGGKTPPKLQGGVFLSSLPISLDYKTHKKKGRITLPSLPCKLGSGLKNLAKGANLKKENVMQQGELKNFAGNFALGRWKSPPPSLYFGGGEEGRAPPLAKSLTFQERMMGAGVLCPILTLPMHFMALYSCFAFRSGLFPPTPPFSVPPLSVSLSRGTGVQVPSDPALDWGGGELAIRNLLGQIQGWGKELSFSFGHANSMEEAGFD